MSTKGPSNRYGNTNGSGNSDRAGRGINYQWAKAFNKNTISEHKHHAEEMGYNSFDDYAAAAVRFANTIDRAHYRSVIDYDGKTYKWDPSSRRLAIIDKRGYIVSFYKMTDGFSYKDQKGKKVRIHVK